MKKERKKRDFTAQKKDDNAPRYKAASYVEIPISLIVPPVIAMRGDGVQDDVSELCESISRYGLINGITVKKAGDKFEIVAGHRRYAACKKLKMKTITAKVEYGDGLKTELIKIHENIVRQDVSIVEESAYLKAIMEKLGINQTKLAALIGRSPAYVTDRLKVNSWDDELREAVQSGEIAFSAARELATVKNNEVRAELVGHARKSGVSPAVAKQWSEDANSAADDISSAGADGVAGDMPAPAQMPSFPCQICGTVHVVTSLRMLRSCPDCIGALSGAAKAALTDPASA